MYMCIHPMTTHAHNDNTSYDVYIEMDIFLLLDNFMMLFLELVQQSSELSSLFFDSILHRLLLTARLG